MPSFAQQLTEVRKRRNMTQEELANAVNISRSRISRWENGNAVPDIDTVRTLSRVLAYDFFADKDLPVEEGTELPEAAEPLQETEESMPVQQTEEPENGNKPSQKKKFLIFGVAGAAAVVLLIVLAFTLFKKPVPQHPVYTLAWYQQEVVSSPKNKANVLVTPAENPVYAVELADFTNGKGWFYTFHFEETNGVDFTIESLVISVFGSDGTSNNQAYDTAFIQQALGSNILHAGAPAAWGGGFPVQDVTHVGMALHGTDAAGHQLTFCGWLELSPEIKNAQ